MVPVHQTIFGNKRGNCLQACVASILELDLDEVPNFVEAQNGEWWKALNDFLLGYGIQPVILDANPKSLEDDVIPWKPKGLHILSGKSPRGDFLHATVYQAEKMIHDPHPDRTGVMSEVDWILFIPLDPAKNGKLEG